jgi:hypothetical protein
VTPALPAGEVAGAPVAAPTGLPVEGVDIGAPSSGGAKLLAVVLLALAAAATLLSGRREALLGLLGGVPAVAAAAPGAGGIGRFSRERTGPPPSLR